MVIFVVLVSIVRKGDRWGDGWGSRVGDSSRSVDESKSESVEVSGEGGWDGTLARADLDERLDVLDLLDLEGFFLWELELELDRCFLLRLRREERVPLESPT